jgi:hypothetical protein
MMNEKKSLNIIKYAPIIVFAYNRADKLEQLLMSLEKNANIKKMDLYIFVDIPDKKNTRDLRYNQEVINFLIKYKNESSAFKNIQIEVSDKHKGLAESIISGVSKIINQFGKAIILEDDLKVSDDFLDYMQRGLVAYKNQKNVWSVAGYSPVFNMPKSYKNDVFLVPRAESLGWGTWSDRWNKCDWQVKTYSKFRKNIIQHIFFNIGGDDLTDMLKRQMQDEEYNSWAIRWGYQQFLEKKYTIYPRESRVIHCGTDNRSTHGAYFDPQILKNNYQKCRFVRLKPDWHVIWEFRKVYKVTAVEKLKQFFSFI